MNICCSLNSPLHPVPLDHFVHMVLFFHCANENYEEPVLDHREEETPDVVKACTLVVSYSYNNILLMDSPSCIGRSFSGGAVSTLEQGDKHFHTTASTQTI
ncbi:hypothetical protein CHARACLAT_009102 [Characodon lateralis]|uniref:Uncharacterized protein n=1 Tax=Characodon lateralis TaxID=208331 RepID=A0ABU7E888_9TELE|nr:hypothetical protein [Characodon lateralis]